MTSMGSQVGWLDFSSEHQQHVYDSLKRFESKETVDDLGFGTIRDAISGALFPGTSVLQTRARYFLFIPWIFQEAQRLSPQKMIERSRNYELRLISALEASDDTSGVIGIQKKTALKTVPSSIYWSGLQKFGIFKLQGRSIQQFGKLAAKHREDIEYEGEFVGRGSPFWCEMPAPPKDFFRFDFAELRLSQKESEWLSERIISTSTSAQPNLLGSLVKMILNGETSFLDEKRYEYVWEFKLPNYVDERLRKIVHHSQHFALLAQGASLIYNALLVEKLKHYGQEITFTADYEEQLLKWASEAAEQDLELWCRDKDEFWSSLDSVQATSSKSAREFVDALANYVSRFGVTDFCTNREVRDCIRDREIHHKSQPRLGRRDRLFAYQGDAGTGLMTFRWDLVKRLLTDISDGRNNRDL
jgi:hypothetical protein